MRVHAGWVPRPTVHYTAGTPLLVSALNVLGEAARKVASAEGSIDASAPADSSQLGLENEVSDSELAKPMSKEGRQAETEVSRRVPMGKEGRQAETEVLQRTTPGLEQAEDVLTDSLCPRVGREPSDAELVAEAEQISGSLGDAPGDAVQFTPAKHFTAGAVMLLGSLTKGKRMGEVSAAHRRDALESELHAEGLLPPEEEPHRCSGCGFGWVGL